MNEKAVLTVVSELKQLTDKYILDESYLGTSIAKDKLSGVIEFDCGMIEVYYDKESNKVLIDRDFY